MQKNYSSLVIKFLLLAFFIILTAFHFSSCKNFLDAKEVKQEIIDYIEYCNATECTLYISQDSSTGVFLSSAKQKCRVGYTTELQVTVNRSNYVFQTLDAVSINDLSVSRLDCLEFKTETIDEEKGIYKIIIKLLKEAHDILLCPVCSLIPKITGVTPTIETSGCEQDLEIKVSFNKEMDKESFGDFSCLKITSDGDDLTSLFATPFFTGNGKTLVITPLCASQSEDFSSSFLLEPSGTVNTRKITVEFNFSGDQKDKEGIPITGFSEYTYKVNKNLSQNELPSMKVEITGDSGDFTPTIGIKDCIKTYTYQLSFRPYDDYEFIRWEIFNKANGTAIQNGTYITIENPDDRNTTYSFAELPEDDSIQVAVRPVLAQRPEIYSWSPIKASQNTYKDSMIQFMFDYDMDPSSIYYSLEEIKTIHNYYNIAYENFLPAVTQAELAGGDAFKELYHYGYKQGSGDAEEYIYKNISITLQDGNKNMNKCFDAPVFEGKRVVTIPSSNKAELPNYAVVQVTIDKNFCYIKDGISVIMKKSKYWTYQVNKEKDGKGPDVPNESDVMVAFSGANGKEIIKGDYPDTPWQTGANQIYNNEQKLVLELKIYDEGTGPADLFTLRLEKVRDNNYEVSSKTYEKTIYFQTINSQNASIENTVVDLSDLDLDDGVYKTSFIFRDKSGNPLEYPLNGKGYYFTVDNAIDMAAPSVTDNSDGTGGKLKLEWAPRPDWEKTKIRWKKKGTSQWSDYDEFTDSNDHSKQYHFAGLSNLTSLYDFEIINYDYKGNSQTVTINDIATASLDSISIAGTPEKTLYFSGEDFDKTGLTVTAHLTNNNSWVINDYSNDLGDSISIGKTVNLSYTLNGDTRDSTVEATYYIAASDALTETPVKTGNVTITVPIDKESNRTYVTKTFDMYKFGDFPQTISANQEASYYTEQPIYKGWHLGSDGYFYEKCLENSYSNSYYSNGEIPKSRSSNSYKYFKVQPVLWRALEQSQDGKILLFTHKVLTGYIGYYPDRAIYYEDTDTGETIYQNNYKYSKIRAYLNGLKYRYHDNYNFYEMTEYENNGFLQKAFTSAAQSYIQITEVDNSVESTLPTYWDTISDYDKNLSWNNGQNRYICENTNDKIFLLSLRDVTTFDYCFTLMDFGFPDFKEDSRDSIYARAKTPTDYAMANFVRMGKYGYGVSAVYYCYYLLRSPGHEIDEDLYRVDNRGEVDNRRDGTYSWGVAPAMWIKVQP